MYKELTIAEAEGKTVKGITRSIISDQMIVAFTDETFITFGIEHGYESCDDVMMRLDLVLEDFGREVIESGIITQEEYSLYLAARADVMRRGREAAERRRYEQLKAKFG